MILQKKLFSDLLNHGGSVDTQRKTNRKWVLAVIVAIVVVALASGAWLLRSSQRTKESTVSYDRSLLARLPQRPNATIDTTHLAGGIVPPTNHWFSGLALNKDPKAVFPLPLSFKAAENGFSFGLPEVTASANTVTGGYNPAVTVGLSAAQYKVIRYDSVSVTLRYASDAGLELGSLTIAEGTPYVSYIASQDQQIALSDFRPIVNGVYQKTVQGKQYGLKLSAGSTYNSNQLHVPKGAAVVFYAVANGTTTEAMAPYATPLVSVTDSYMLQAKVAQTRLSYKTTGGETLYAALPEQHIMASVVAGFYDSIYGKLSLYKASNIRFDEVRATLTTKLSLSMLTAAEKTELKNYVAADAAATNLSKTDSYFGGKELYRAANLYMLARSLGMNAEAKNLKLAITTDLSQWFDPAGSTLRDNRYFYYDTTARGLVGAEASFGADQFNDHHFHFGYFIYAAAVIGADDPAMAQKYQPFVRLLAYDIAAPTSDTMFPRQRVFDPYVGHSWASGYGQFDDGNNQESSSEAVNAWNALGAWAMSVGDTQLANQATWQLSREQASASINWTAIDTTANQFKGYAHQTVGINWGGKRDYATFFSAEPAAILGIQLIPMNPAMTALAAQGSRIGSNLKATIPDGNYQQKFGDYLLMYRALTDKNGALQAAKSMQNGTIDDANSRAYMMAWILSQK